MRCSLRLDETTATQGMGQCRAERLGLPSIHPSTVLLLQTATWELKHTAVPLCRLLLALWRCISWDKQWFVRFQIHSLTSQKALHTAAQCWELSSCRCTSVKQRRLKFRKWRRAWIKSLHKISKALRPEFLSCISSQAPAGHRTRQRWGKGTLLISIWGFFWKGSAVHSLPGRLSGCLHFLSL